MREKDKFAVKRDVLEVGFARSLRVPHLQS